MNVRNLLLAMMDSLLVFSCSACTEARTNWVATFSSPPMRARTSCTLALKYAVVMLDTRVLSPEISARMAINISVCPRADGRHDRRASRRDQSHGCDVAFL